MALTVAAINAYLRTAAGTGWQFVGNEFASDSADKCAYTRLSGGSAPSEWTQKAEPGVQIIVRATDVAAAEAKANEILTLLHRKAEFTLGGVRIVRCLADQSTPWYIGKDANGRALYSLNFTFTTM
jgi:hypothetical protein